MSTNVDVSSASGISASAGGSGLFRVVLKCSLHLFSLASYSVMSWFCPSASLWTCTKFSCPSVLLLFPLLLQDVRHAAVCLVLLKSSLICPRWLGVRQLLLDLFSFFYDFPCVLGYAFWLYTLLVCNGFFCFLVETIDGLPEGCWSDSSKQSFLIAQTSSLATSKRWSLLSPIFAFFNLKVRHK